MAGFYVDWDEHSYESLRAHLDRLDWVIAEWAFIAPVRRHAADRRTTPTTSSDLINQVPKARRPKVLLMVSNVLEEHRRDGSAGVNTLRLLADSGARRRAARDWRTQVDSLHLAGVTVDFESVPDQSLPLLGSIPRRPARGAWARASC